MHQAPIICLYGTIIDMIVSHGVPHDIKQSSTLCAQFLSSLCKIVCQLKDSLSLLS